MARYHRVAPEAFAGALERLGIYANGRRNRSYEAVRLVMCDGMAIILAARMTGVSREAIRKALRKVKRALGELDRCPHCGQPMPARREPDFIPP